MSAARATYDVPEACARLGISRTHGYKLCREGAFPAKVVKLGNRYIVVAASLDALLSDETAEEAS